MKLYRSREPIGTQIEGFEGGEVPIAVYGLGKMGLPLAAVFAETTGNVVGADVDEEVVESINRGVSHVDREPGLPELVEETVNRGSLRAVTDPSEAARRATVHIVIVPTLIDDMNEPDISILESVAADIGPELTAGEFVIIESTVPPGTTSGRVLPLLKDLSGLEQGEFGLAFCPERTASGRAVQDIRGAYPKVVGGVDDESTRVAALIYERINSNSVLAVRDATTAETVKVFEGVYRDVNIALANELAQFADELAIDINEAIEVANTQPFCDIHAPGPGVGGHCIPYYPYFLIKPYQTPSPLLQTARAVNDGMPAFTVRKLQEELRDQGVHSLKGTQILLLGLTYRPGVEETRASPAIAIAHLLHDEGSDVYAVDPILGNFDSIPVQPIDLEGIYDRPFDAVMAVTAHEEFEDIRWADLQPTEGRLTVIDCIGIVDHESFPYTLYTIGVGH